MEFKEALQKSLKSDKHTHTDPFLLHSHVSDLVGNDYETKKAAEEFYRLDAKYEISKTILGSAPVRYKKRKKHYYKIKPMPIPPDDAYVYHLYGSPILHLSSECPCLKGDGYFLRDTYKWARFRQYRTRNGYNFELNVDSEKIKKYPTRICRNCGKFTPKTADGFMHKVLLFLYEWFAIEPREKIVFSFNRRTWF